MAGIQLARQGFGVEIYEKRADVGLRHHNDFQGLENWSQRTDVLQVLRDLGLQTDFFARPFKSGLLYLPSLRPIRVRSPQTMFYLIKRGPGEDTFDSLLKRQALDAGVRIHFNSGSQPDADIIATGPPQANILAAGLNFETSQEDQARGILSDDVAPKGYAYLLVADGRATLATVLFRDFASAQTCLQKAVDAFRRVMRLDMRNPRSFVGYGYFGAPKSGLRGKKLYLGEAVGFQDFLFGFGLRYALLSGYYAAHSIISGANYDVLWKHAFGKYLVNSLVNRFFYERFTRAAYHVLRVALGLSENPRWYMRLLYGSPLQRCVYPMLPRNHSRLHTPA